MVVHLLLLKCSIHPSIQIIKLENSCFKIVSVILNSPKFEWTTSSIGSRKSSSLSSKGVWQRHLLKAFVSLQLFVAWAEWTCRNLQKLIFICQSGCCPRSLRPMQTLREGMPFPRIEIPPDNLTWTRLASLFGKKIISLRRDYSLLWRDKWSIEDGLTYTNVSQPPPLKHFLFRDAQILIFGLSWFRVRCFFGRRSLFQL